MKDDFCVIMAGGIGARFWPMSRTLHPKQFIDILGTGTTLIQQTFNRFLGVCPRENIYIVTNEMYRDLVMEQLPGIREEQVLCEPARRNTAPCIAYAAYKISLENKEANIVVAPSDHIIMKEEAFISQIKTALKDVSKHDHLLTLGIKPSRPDTGYGYIQYVKGKNEPGEKEGICKVRTFTEKPNLKMAKTFLKSGDFLWNSGIFIWSLKSILDAFGRYLPEVNNIFREGIGKYNTAGEKKFITRAYNICKNISIDYGIMEKADNVYVLPSDFGWSDLGTWGSLHDIRNQDSEGNAVTGKNVMTYDTTNSIIHMPKDKLVVLQGLDNYIVVEDDDILLVCRKKDEQQIRQIVNDVKMEKGDKYI
jgi:mannose-1-phosphate guanylyltransferase